MQEHEGISSLGFGVTLKGFDEYLYGDLRCDIALVVPAHSVCNDQHQGITRITMGQADLVVGALAWSAFLINCEFHWTSIFLLNFPTTWSSQCFFRSSGLGTFFVSAFCRAKTLCGRLR